MRQILINWWHFGLDSYESMAEHFYGETQDITTLYQAIVFTAIDKHWTLIRGELPPQRSFL